MEEFLKKSKLNPLKFLKDQNQDKFINKCILNQIRNG